MKFEGRPIKRGPGEQLEPSLTREAYESALLDLLLREHDATQARLLAYDALGRLLSAVLIIYLGVVTELSATRLLSGFLAAVLIATFWQWGRFRATRRLWSIEESLSRMTEGPVERAYIESRFIAESGRGALDGVLKLEPGAWLCASLLVATVSVIVSGITT